MGSLTYSSQDGTWGLKGHDIKKLPSEFYGAMCKLHDYEKTGLSPEQIIEMDELYAEKCKEVAELEKKVAAFTEAWNV